MEERAHCHVCASSARQILCERRVSSSVSLLFLSSCAGVCLSSNAAPHVHRHRPSRHQYYLQLRRDVLDERLLCDEDTCLFLGALALQAEFGDCVPEVLPSITQIYYQHFNSIYLLDLVSFFLFDH